MDWVPVVSVVISSLGFFVGGGAIWKLIEVGRQQGRMEQQMVTLEARTSEDRKHDAEKFDRLYEGRNKESARFLSSWLPSGLL